jgi:LemA protein
VTTALWAVAGIGALALVWFVATYNRFVRLKQHLRDSWAGIDVELKRRHDLIPNLVQVVRGYAEHERTVLERVVDLRNRAAATGDDHAELAQRESALMRGMRDLFAVVERYPELKADRRYGELQRELAITEDRIAAARRFYNGNVRDWVVLRDSFPSNALAAACGFGRHDPGYFALAGDAERVVPRVLERATP